MRINAYIIHKKLSRERDRLAHKQFVMEWIDCFNERAARVINRRTVTRSLREEYHRKQPRVNDVKPRAPHVNCKMEDERLEGPLHCHRREKHPTGAQQTCRYCAYLHAVAKRDDTEPPKKKGKPSYWCSACKCHLCKECFEPFHERGEDDDEDHLGDEALNDDELDEYGVIM